MNLPELSSYGPSVRIPPQRDVVLTPRIRAVVDSPPFQRLRRVRQLGPTHLVYPGAVHTRFEHSVGVYGYTVRCVTALLRHPNVANSLSEADVLTVLAAGLLHDCGHYPFAHSLEALHRQGSDTPRHEDLGREIVTGSLAPILERELGVDPERVASLFCRSWTSHSGVDSLLASMVSSAVDADKMDYLERDSAHLGVPYGRSFDVERLLGALTVSEDERCLAIDAKGKIPAEMFVFSRYMMFSEAYWHHTVRAASAMVEAALFDHVERFRPDVETLTEQLLRLSDDEWLAHVGSVAPNGSVARDLAARLLSPQRALYKRLVTYSRAYAEPWKRQAYRRLYEASSDELSTIRSELAVVLGRELNVEVGVGQVLIDTPPRDKDHPETIDVRYPRAQGQTTYALHDLSRVVAGVHSDFVAVVKKIRIFVAPELAERARPRQHAIEEALARVVLG